MRRKSKIFILLTAATVLGIAQHNRKRRKQRLRAVLTVAQERFVKKATLIEAQQVAFYHLLSLKAGHLGLPHLAAGYQRAMEEEARHLKGLKIAGRRLGIPLATWELIGDSIGRFSGKAVSKLSPTIWLRITNKLEKVAAKDYASQRQGLGDEALQELYMENQIDEEKHFSWAALMLKQLSLADQV